MNNSISPTVLKSLRNARCLTLEELSKKAIVKEEFVRLYEANRYDLGPFALERLAEALGATEEAVNA